MLSSQDQSDHSCSNPLPTNSRERKLTDKGLWCKIDTLRSNFCKSISAWRTWIMKTEVFIRDSNDSHVICDNGDVLLEHMDEINSIYKQLTHMLKVECKTNEHKECLLRLRLVFNSDPTFHYDYSNQ